MSVFEKIAEGIKKIQEKLVDHEKWLESLENRVSQLEGKVEELERGEDYDDTTEGNLEDNLEAMRQKRLLE